MEINNVTEMTTKKELAKSQLVVETKLPTALAATKVLGINPSLTLSVTECFSGEVRISGSATLALMYLCGEETAGGSATVDFSDRIECKASAGTQAVATGRILDTDIVAIEADCIRLASVIEITVHEMTLFSLPPVSLPDGVYGDETRVKCSTVTSHFSTKAAFEGEEIFKAESLISNCGRVILTNCEAALDTVIVTGEILIDVSGISGGSGVCGVMSIPLSEEISARGTRSGDIVCVRAKICKIGSIESGGGFTFAATVLFDGESYAKTSLDVLSDVFSVTNKVSKEIKTVSLCDVKGSAIFDEKAEGSIMLAEGDSADTILALMGFELTLEKAYSHFDKVVVVGAISGTVVYYDADAAMKKAVSALIPFSLTVGAEASEGDDIDVSGDIGKIGIKLRRSGEIDIKAEVGLQVTVMGKINAEAISGITLAEKLDAANGAISVYVAGEKESLFGCAKSLCVSPELITAQNPSLEFPLKRSQKVIIFRNQAN